MTDTSLLSNLSTQSSSLFAIANLGILGYMFVLALRQVVKEREWQQFRNPNFYFSALLLVTLASFFVMLNNVVSVLLENLFFLDIASHSWPLGGNFRFALYLIALSGSGLATLIVSIIYVLVYSALLGFDPSLLLIIAELFLAAYFANSLRRQPIWLCSLAFLLSFFLIQVSAYAAILVIGKADVISLLQNQVLSNLGGIITALILCNLFSKAFIRRYFFFQAPHIRLQEASQ